MTGKFDFVESASHAYQYCWNHRQKILSLCAGFLLFKCVCFLAVLNIFSDMNILRQNLFMMPAYFFEGLMIAKIIGCAQGRGAARSALAMIDVDERAAAITYALTKLVLFFLGGVTIMEQQSLVEGGATPSEPNGMTFFLALAILAGLIWGFRLLWLYVPVAMGYPMRLFLQKFRGFGASFPMIGTWIICFAPIGVALVIVSQILAVVLGVEGTGERNLIYMNISGLVQVFLDFVMSLVSSLGMAYAFRAVLEGGTKPRLKK